MPDFGEILQNPEFEGLLRIIVAGLLGGLIGHEREMSGKPAGIRTYGLVGMGAAAFTAVGMLAFGDGDPVSRVAQGIITGIGFLGAGTILQTKRHVLGLTTAAGIWVAAAVGMAIGAGLYVIGIGSAIAVFLLLQFVNPGVLIRFGLATRDDVEGRVDDDEGTSGDEPSAREKKPKEDKK